MPAANAELAATEVAADITGDANATAVANEAVKVAKAHIAALAKSATPELKAQWQLKKDFDQMCLSSGGPHNAQMIHWHMMGKARPPSSDS